MGKQSDNRKVYIFIIKGSHGVHGCIVASYLPSVFLCELQKHRKAYIGKHNVDVIR